MLFPPIFSLQFVGPIPAHFRLDFDHLRYFVWRGKELLFGIDPQRLDCLTHALEGVFLDQLGVIPHVGWHRVCGLLAGVPPRQILHQGCQG